jgi:hypothetical protein
MAAHTSMKRRHNTSSILPGSLYFINTFSLPCSAVIHSHICRREFTVPSLFPLFASNTDLMTSLSIFGNISSIWKINKRPTYDNTILDTVRFFSSGWVVIRQSVLCSSQSSYNWPSTQRWKVREGCRWVDRQTEMMMSSRRLGPYQDLNPSQPCHSLMTFQIMSQCQQNSEYVTKRGLHNQY